MFGSGREAFPESGSHPEALPDVREWSGGLPGCPGVFGWPSRMCSRSKVALPDVGSSPGCPELVWNSPRCPGLGRRSSSMSKCGREAHPDNLERLCRPPAVRESSGGPPVCPGVVGRPPRCPGVVRRPSRMYGSGREAL